MSFFREFSAATGLAGLAGLAGLVLAACQPLPRPFAPAGARHGDALELSDHGGIVVLAVSGIPETVGQAMAAGMVKALQDQNVPAATGGGNRKSHFLQGWSDIRRLRGGRVRIDVVWDLFDPAGAVIGSQPVRREVAGYRWDGGDRTLLLELATAAARPIAALVQDGEPGQRPALPRPLLHVAAVSGAPGGGGAELRRAMARALADAGFRLSDTPAPDGLVIEGRVALAPPGKGRQSVEIVWAVRRADGVELGRLAQHNTVPAGSLDGAWGRTAAAIANSAVGGVQNLLRQVAPALNFQAPPPQPQP